MIKLVDYRTENALPTEMKTPERIALSYAFDRQKKRYFDRVKRLYIWADLECVSDDKLDFLAVENRVLFYNSSLAPDVKRNLIRNSIYWYMKLGTRQATEEMISIICKNKHTSVEEWYTYGGEPFHFRVIISIDDNSTKIDIEDLIKKIIRYKRSIARLDTVNLRKSKETKIHVASGKEIFVRLKIGVDPYCKNIDRKTKIHMGIGSVKYLRIDYSKKQED